MSVLAAHHEVGEALTAYYDPADPSASTLEPALNPFLIAVLIFATPFVIFFVVLPIAGLVRRKNYLATQAVDHSGMTMSAPLPLIIYVLLSAVAGLGLGFTCKGFSWRWGVGIGLALWIAILPGASWLAGRWTRAKRTEQELQARAAMPADVRKRVLVLAGASIFWWFIVGMFIWHAGSAMWKSRDAVQRFSEAQGEVIESRVESHTSHSSRGGSRTSYRPFIRYRYRVQDTMYESARYDVGGIQGTDEQEAAKVVALFPPGAKVPVYYDPESPGSALLRWDVPESNYFLLYFLQPFVLVGLVLVGYTVGLPVRSRRIEQWLAADLKPPWLIPTWGTLREGPAGLAVVVQTPCLIAAVVTYGVACVLGIFLNVAVAALGHGWNLGAMGAAFVASVLAAVATAWLVRRGRRARLEINPAAKQLTLRRPSDAVTIDFDKIQTWVQRPLENPRFSDRQYARFAPLLAIDVGERKELPIHIFPGWGQDRRIPDKVGEEFAKLTGRPFRKINNARDVIPKPSSQYNLSEMFTYLRAVWRHRREYRDIM